MTKPNLIITQPFPINRTLINEFLLFLEEYFTVYFIELPGFSPQNPLNHPVSLKYYIDFTQSKIDSLKLDSYLLAGISFGYYLSCHLSLKQNCQGIAALEPFVSRSFVKKSIPVKTAISLITKACQIDQISNSTWQNDVFWKALKLYQNNHNQAYFDTIRHEIDPKAFFGTLNIIAQASKPPQPQTKRHVVILASRDELIDPTATERWFRKILDPQLLRVMYINTSHYPKENSKDYFTNILPDKQILQLIDFLTITV